MCKVHKSPVIAVVDNHTELQPEQVGMQLKDKVVRSGQWVTLTIIHTHQVGSPSPPYTCWDKNHFSLVKVDEDPGRLVNSYPSITLMDSTAL